MTVAYLGFKIRPSVPLSFPVIFVRWQLVNGGKLPGSSDLPFTVELGVEMIEIDTLPHERNFYLSPATTRAVTETVTGAYEVWFEPETGEARISVETDHERTLLILALEGERS